MKIIAIRDFRNPGQRLEIEGARHPDHIHKGAVITFGKEADTFKQLSKADQELLMQLTAANCLGDATDEKVVAAVAREVKAEKVVEDRQAAQLAPAKK